MRCPRNEKNQHIKPQKISLSEQKLCTGTIEGIMQSATQSPDTECLNVFESANNASAFTGKKKFIRNKKNETKKRFDSL